MIRTLEMIHRIYTEQFPSNTATLAQEKVTLL